MSLTSEYRIRLARPDDIFRLIPLRYAMQCEVAEAELAASPPSSTLPGADHAPLAIRRGNVIIDPAFREACLDYFRTGFQNETYLAALAETQDGTAVSANGLVLYRKPPGLGSGSGRVGYLTNVYTSPDFRALGLAERLLLLLIDEAKRRGVEKIHLGTTDAGRRLYDRCGFTPVRCTPLELTL